MEPLSKVIVYPILGILYVALPCLSRPHFSLPSFMPAFPYTVSYWRRIFGTPSRPEIYATMVAAVIQIIFVLVVMATTAGSCFFVFSPDEPDIGDVSILILIPRTIILILSIWYCSTGTGIYFSVALGLLGVVAVVIIPSVLMLSIDCLVYLSPLSYPVTRAVARFIIFALKNRRACQFLSALAAVVLGVTKAKVFTAIPISFGIFLSVPDLEPDPWVDFKLRFAKFLEANMDAESVDAFLHSKSSKLVSCNEMMPELGPVRRVRSITAAASFVCGPSFSPGDEHFNVEAEYRIGLGSITTSTRGDVIDVHIFTPCSGVKKRTIANTPRSRYNLDMSARFGKKHPHVGILNTAFERDKVHKEGELHCIGVDKWIKLCGSKKYVFKEYSNELGTSC